MDFKAFIEIPLNSNIKYEVDEETGELTVDRFLHTAMSYPFNYGYVKGTKGKDDDPLDVCIFSSLPVKKIDPIFGVWTNIKDVPEIILLRTKHFFDHMKELEPGKWVKTGEFKDAPEAEKEIDASKNK